MDEVSLFYFYIILNFGNELKLSTAAADFAKETSLSILSKAKQHGQKNIESVDVLLDHVFLIPDKKVIMISKEFEEWKADHAQEIEELADYFMAHDTKKYFTGDKYNEAYKKIEDLCASAVVYGTMADNEPFCKEIKKPEETFLYDSVKIILQTSFSSKKIYHSYVIDQYSTEDEPSTLGGLQQMIEKKYGHIRYCTVIAESGLCGDIFRYGNHGNFWERTGKTCGYA